MKIRRISPDTLRISTTLITLINIVLIPWQSENPQNSVAHWVHLSPITFSLQVHFPLFSSHSMPTDPSSLHSQAKKADAKIHQKL